jgi:hypothetical protein
MIDEFRPDRVLFDLTASIVDSDAVIRTFASCEWDCLSDDGKVWLCAIVHEVLRRHGVALVPVLPVRLVDLPRRSEDPRLACANDKGEA